MTDTHIPKLQNLNFKENEIEFQFKQPEPVYRATVRGTLPLTNSYLCM